MNVNEPPVPDGPADTVNHPAIPQVVESIREFNAGRDPERLAMKYRAMRASAFAFLRGTCHLFVASRPRDAILLQVPLAWACGDLHLENFGSYRGDDHQRYFDINDFDEAALAPLTWDPLRLMTSVLVAADTMALPARTALALCGTFAASYGAALAEGKARWIERDTASGLVGQLLASLHGRDPADLLDRRTERVKGSPQRRLRCDGRHALPASEAQRLFATGLVDRLASTRPSPGFFRVLDVARRVAGTGSLGLERYVVLVEGKGSPDGNRLLDLKAVPPSSVATGLDVKQPRWTSEAERAATLQQRLQAVPVAFLQPTTAGQGSFLLRELLPSEDRVALHPGMDGAALDQLVADMGRIVAWDQLRSAGRQGSATADELVDFGSRHATWGDGLVALAQACAQRTRTDWATYAHAFDAGAFA